MRTAEQILQAECDKDRLMFYDAKLGKIDGDSASVLSAMDEWAKIISVEFLDYYLPRFTNDEEISNRTDEQKKDHYVFMNEAYEKFKTEKR